MRKNRRRQSKDTTKGDIIVLAQAMRLGDPTPFELEGPGVQAVRISRCLSGWPWERADQEAREVVTAALRRVGAVRPAWQEGQPVPHGEGWRVCVTCGGWLYGSYEARHCSEACKRTYARVSVGLPPPARRMRHCRHCKGPLPEGRSDLRYCSEACKAARWEKRHPDRVADLDARLGTLHRCECCGTVFRRYVRPSWPAPRFCCRRCVATTYGGEGGREAGVRRRAAAEAARKLGPRPVRAGSAECRDDLPSAAE